MAEGVQCLPIRRTCPIIINHTVPAAWYGRVKNVVVSTDLWVWTLNGSWKFRICAPQCMERSIKGKERGYTEKLFFTVRSAPGSAG